MLPKKLTRFHNTNDFYVHLDNFQVKDEGRGKRTFNHRVLANKIWGILNS